MLKKFKVRNFKNFREELCLDLSKVSNYEFNTEAVKNGALKCILVYGDNGSGKTNLGYALFDIMLHLTENQKRYNNYRLYRNLDLEEDTEFSYLFEFEEGELEYVYRKVSAQELSFEKIVINGKEILEYDYKTHKGKVYLQGAESLNIELIGNNLSFVKYVASNTVLVNNSDNRIFRKFIEYVNNMLWFSSLERNEYQGYTIGAENIAQGIIARGKLKDFQEFLHKVGLNYQMMEKEVDGDKMIYCKYKQNTVNFFNVASRGTCSLALFYYWLIRIESVSLVFIDEFDAFYHNNLAETVVKELMALTNTQSILTTHNTDIMSNDLLRPDCYLQIRNGTIKSFAESTTKELRKAHNLQKMYNSGAFDE